MQLFGKSEQFDKRAKDRLSGLEQYNLDMIISIGYRVNSKRGTQFRIWANKILKEYLTNSYALNQKALKEKAVQLDALKQTVRILSNVIESTPLTSDETNGL